MEQRPYPIEPMRAGTIVARSFSTYFRNFSSFAIFVFILSGMLSLASFISGELISVQGVNLSFAELIELFRTADIDEISRYLMEWRQTSDTPSKLGILTFAASLFLSPLVSGGIAFITTGFFMGEKRTPGEWFRSACSKYKSLFVTHICSILLLGGIVFAMAIVLAVLLLIFSLVIAFVSPFLGILLIIAAIVIFVLILIFFIAAQSVSFAVVIREDIYGFKPNLRSIKLCYSRLWRTIGLGVLSTLVLSLCVFACSFILGLILDIFSIDNTLFSRLFDNLLIPLLFSPLTPIAFGLHYVSLRIEKEGYLEIASDTYNAPGTGSITSDASPDTPGDDSDTPENH